MTAEFLTAEKVYTLGKDYSHSVEQNHGNKVSLERVRN